MAKQPSRSDRDRLDRSNSGGGRKDSSSSLKRDRLSSKEDRRLRNEREPLVKSGRLSLSSSSCGKSDPSSSKQTNSSSFGKTNLIPPTESKMDVDKDPVTLNKKELYESVVEHENNLAKSLNATQSLSEGHNICAELEKNLQEIMSMLTTPTTDEDDFEDKMEEGLMKLSSLRLINRMMKLKLKSVKDEQLSVRSGVDSDHLHLQNLLYEATILQKQAAAVQEYKGKDALIDLIPIEQFYEEAPEKITKTKSTKSDPHLQRIARLEYEFVQRRKLTEDCNSLEKEKESASKRITDTQGKLDSICPLLNSILDATKPLQQIFGIEISSKKEENEIAQYLPAELYVLFVQSNAFREANEKMDLVVHLRGNVEAAKELMVTPEEDKDDSDSDKELDFDETETSRRVIRKKSSNNLSREDAKNKLIEKHPLWIEWIVSSKGSNAVLIQFFYLRKLKIITVKAKTVDDVNKIPDCEIASSESLLEDLFPDDTGLYSPNPANRYLLQKVDTKEIADFVSATGRPFLWAQRLAGVEFPPLTEHSDANDESLSRPKMETSYLNIEIVLKKIKLRLSNQTALHEQLKLLEAKNLEIPTDAKELFPAKLSTTFKSWESINFTTYCSYSFAKEHLRTDIVAGENIFFRACLERGRARITALVTFTSNFPITPPVFSIQLEKEGAGERNSTNDAVIRHLECEVNLYCLEDFQQWPKILASLQLLRLIQGIDIILETDFLVGESSSSSEFVNEKLLLRASTGRNLRRPFKYCGTGGGYFSQRY
ncbi:THO complex subunit 5 homolog isoform X2 [Folsomia candida]|uniref:THO complex subunit 5 homolog isoform X2 n=1 Tax=Folsomia candida TaxID=158441 RepID=UPI000B8F627C|nr:THO complex subunit 5 homolog isoform X2 [Folsomia candida]